MSPDAPNTYADYAQWVADHDTLSGEDRRLIAAHVALLPSRPLISVVMPAYETQPTLLRQAIASVQAQLYPFWELCVADDASPSRAVSLILEEAAARDPRIRWTRRPVNGHISAATNTAIGLSSGPFVALLDHDDLLPERALYEVAVEINACPDAEILYSDEDRVDADGGRSQPYFKPMWSPELLCGHNMISHLGVYRRALLDRIGHLRLGYEGSQDWDLALRATAAASPSLIRHIPAILYHWRWNAGTASFSEASLGRCQAAGAMAVEDWLEREGVVGAQLSPAPLATGWSRVRYPMPEPVPHVTVIVPTKDRAALLERVCDGVLNGTAWPSGRLDLILVDNGSVEPAATACLDVLAAHPSVTVLRAPGLFNYARLNNLAASGARGDILVLLNNDIEVDDPDWLSAMVRLTVLRETGAVGAKLLYPDGRVQHAGVATGPRGLVGHIQRLLPADDPGYCGQLALTRAVSAVTGACLAVRREVYEEAGGLDESFAVAFNDIDFCLRLRDLGYRIVWTPDAVLTHHESASRDAAYAAGLLPGAEDEWARLRARWGSALDSDPYHNPNLLLHDGGGPMIPAPPRRTPPWRGSEIARARSRGL